MRKKIVEHQQFGKKEHHNDEWLPLEEMASAELTSEDPAFPLENALSTHPERNEKGWAAGAPGAQTITLYFSEPVKIQRIFLHFVELEFERTQEFSLRYAIKAGEMQEIVRQQWNFSPNGATQEFEDYVVDLDGVAKLELRIDPDLGGGKARATLDAWRVA